MCLFLLEESPCGRKSCLSLSFRIVFVFSFYFIESEADPHSPFPVPSLELLLSVV